MKTNTPNLAGLKDVTPENRAAMAEAATMKEVANVSTEQVLKTPDFDSEKYKTEMQAQAGMAEHLNFVASVPNIGSDPVAQIRRDLGAVANQLSRVRLPDTRVAIAGQEITIPYEVKAYANEVDQAKYTRYLGSLLGVERMDLFKAFSTKANMATKPALWLNQMICVETKKPYVFMINQELPKILGDEQLIVVDKEDADKAEEYLRILLGHNLFTGIKQVADVNKLQSYAVFVLLVDVILETHKLYATPETSLSIWDGVTTPNEEDVRPLMTAAQANRR
jgi:hypothetical protein